MELFSLVFLIFLLPVFAEQIPDYNNPYAPIFTDKPVYTWTDKVQMTILAPSWNTNRYLIDSIGDDDHPIKISTREHSLAPYRFTETDVNSGRFTAEIILTGFSHDVDGDGDFDTTPRTIGNGPTNGFLETDRDSAITITFEFANRVVLTKSIPIQWNIGTIQFSESNYLLNKTATVHVIDPDLNLNPEALDQIPIQISSNSDMSGIEVAAVETSETSGVFVATISFTQNLSSSGNRLYAIPGDTIFAKYDDYTLPKPYSIADNLAVETSAVIGSSSSALQSLPIIFSDSMGNQILTVSANDQIQIVGKILNPQNFKQRFVYLFQVKDENNFVVSLSWIQGEISANQNLDISQSWIPQKNGKYTIETYAWNSLTNAAPLSPSLSTSVFVN
ncbi:MAG: hypothetical protein COY74_05825 [Nitrosopumilales archaeon CG_4_10_14_0_8_um_filter_34_8]|nr:MAG: hypothetical protein COY74_05825 [Nitrosopumilales archaeon CG_4_10_14_0_8_um_filter_34_8]PJB96842.1 MAG: hypothetical protein CO079_09065 [Nitrosopumilales archaeon CG_4_9_14_0_8_um_filter_34_10]